MNYYRSGIKVGLLVTLSLALFVTLILSIGGSFVFRPMTSMLVYFHFAGGLEEHAPVYYAGVKVGKVTKISVVPDDQLQGGKKRKVEVQINVVSSLQVDQSVQASINTLGMLGEKYVELVPLPLEEREGVAYAQEGDVLYGDDPVQFSQFLNIGKRIALRFENVMASIDELVSDRQTKESLRAAILGAHELVDGLNSLVSSNRPVVDQILQKLDNSATSLESMLGNADGIVGENREDIRSIVQNLNQTIKSAKVFAKKIEKSPSSLVWKSKAEKRAEREEARAKAEEEGKELDAYGRSVSKRRRR